MMRCRIVRNLVALWLVALSTCWCLQSLKAIPPDANDEALRVMCQRGLAQSAAEYCRAQADLFIENAPVRSRWIMRQMECQCQAALSANPTDETKWALVAQSESEYRGEFPEDPRLPWLAWQVARGELLRAQQALAKWLATPAAEAQRESALQAVRKIQTQLDALETNIKERLPLSQPRATGSANTAATQAPNRQLQELQTDCALLRCESLLVRARCYSLQSTDHLAALADVDRVAAAVLDQSAQDWASRDELQVAQATAGLEVGKRRQSLQTLAAIVRGQSADAPVDPQLVATVAPLPPSPLAQLRAGSALVEALCADKNPDAAEQFLKLLQQSQNGPEIDLSQLRIDITRMNQLPATARAGALKTIVADTQSFGQRYGAYWRSRAEALLVAQASSDSVAMTTPDRTPKSSEPTNPPANPPSNPLNNPQTAPLNELLTIEIRQLLAGGQVTAAITKLRTSATAANTAGRAEEALQYATEAAKLLQKEKQWLIAADLLAPLAKEHPQTAGAAAAHVLAAWCIAQALQGTPTQALEKRYEVLLRDQLSVWPAATETIKAEEYMSAWLASQKRFDELATLWLDRAEVNSSAERQVAALNQWLATLLGRLPKAQVPPQLIRLARDITAGKLAACQRTATIIALAGAMLTHPFTQSEAELFTQLKTPGYQLDQSPQDQALLSVVFALAAARAGQVNETRSAIDTLDVDQLTALVNLAWCKAMVEAMDELSSSQVSNWTKIAELVRFPAEQSTRLTPALKMVQLRLEQLSSVDHAAPTGSLTKMKQLAGENANDPNMQLMLAAAIAQSATAEQGGTGLSPEAIKLVKRVAVGTKKDSEAYLRARWLEAQWNLGRGDTKAAAQIAKLTLSSHEIEPAWWKARFEELAKP